MRKKPKRLFRDRRPPANVHDRRRVHHGTEPIVDPPDLAAMGLDPSKCLVYVPVHRFVDVDTWNCIESLRDLDFEVHLSKGASAIDLTRSMMASEAIQAGFEQILMIDSDMLFDPADAIGLLLRPESVVAGVYAAKALGPRAKLNVDFGPSVRFVTFGPKEGTRPVHKIGAGFLRIRTDFLRRMVKELKLPYCNMGSGFGWPFFLPMIVQEDNTTKYLPEDYAFCRRCQDMDELPHADMSIRLYHLGDYTYGIEEARGDYVPRLETHDIEIQRPPCMPAIEPSI